MAEASEGGGEEVSWGLVAVASGFGFSRMDPKMRLRDAATFSRAPPSNPTHDSNVETGSDDWLSCTGLSPLAEHALAFGDE